MKSPPRASRCCDGSPRSAQIPAAVLGLVLLIRLPFLNQAIQGDDHIYLTEAQHALVDPLHPNNVKYVFMGDEVDLRGHSHPPGNAWPLAGLLLLFGDVKEVPFHAAYIVFSLIAVWAMWSLACRFRSARCGPRCSLSRCRRLWSTEVRWRPISPSWPSGWRRSRSFCPAACCLAALAMAAAAMMAYQAVFLLPILFCGIRLRLLCRRLAYACFPGRLTAGRRAPEAGLACSYQALAYATLSRRWSLIAWQVSRASPTGPCRPANSAGYFSTYGFQAIEHKLQNALLMLFIHTWWIVFPALVPATAASRLAQAPRPRHRLPCSPGLASSSPARWWCSSPDRRAICCPWPRRSPSWPRASPSKWLARPAFAATRSRARSRHRQLPALGRLPPRSPPALTVRLPPDTACGWITIGACATTWKATTPCPRAKANTCGRATSS